MPDARLVVALPVKDEAERLPACIAALASQPESPRLTVLVLVNNSTDGSAGIARAIGTASRCRVVVEEALLPPRDANAGGARRIAMAKAANLAGDDGIVLTTDADSRVAPDWLRANLRHIQAGADAVAGRAIIDPIDEARIPPALVASDALECRYAAQLDQIAAAIDPDPFDLWPRHDEHSGASIAVTVAAFRRAGGIPDLPMGEDRAFFHNLRRIDARIRHCPHVQVVVSGRTEGRAAGGMADTIRRRLVCPDMFLDERLEPLKDAVLRLQLRRRTRLLWAEGAADYWAVAALARDLRLPSARVRQTLAAIHFGQAWDDLETASPALRRRRVPAASVEREIALAAGVLGAWESPPVAQDQLIEASA